MNIGQYSIRSLTVRLALSLELFQFKLAEGVSEVLPGLFVVSQQTMILSYLVGQPLCHREAFIPSAESAEAAVSAAKARCLRVSAGSLHAFTQGFYRWHSQARLSGHLPLESIGVLGRLRILKRGLATSGGGSSASSPPQ